MLAAVDDGVGRLLAKIREHGLEENTLIFYLSDNGGATNNGSVNTPLRAHKGSLYEGGIHVPFVAQWVGTLPSGVDDDRPVISLDIMATIAALSGAPLDAARPLDGVNLMPYLTGADPRPAPSPTLLEKVRRQQPCSSGRRLQAGGHRPGDGGNGTLQSPDGYRGEEPASQSTSTRRRVLRIEVRAKNTRPWSMMKAWELWSRQLKPLAFPTLSDDVWW